MDERLLKIFKSLLLARSPLTSTHLANSIQVTSRTIRNDIKELAIILEEYGATVKSIRGTGYQLVINQHETFQRFVHETMNNPATSDSYTPEGRIQYIINRLLLTNDYLKQEELADDLYISKSTLQKLMRDVKKVFEKYNIEIEMRPNYGMKLKGEEISLRFCLSEHLLNRSENEIEKINDLVKIVTKEELQTIRTIILKKVYERDVTLSDIGLNNLIIHLAIACKRIRDNNYVLFINQEINNLAKQKEYDVALEIINNVGEKLNVDFPPSEIAYAAIHLLGTKMISNDDLDENEVANMLDENIHNLANEMVERVENSLKIGVEDDRELYLGICLHLKPAINRYRYKMNIRNPMLEAIKTNYPLAFQAGIIAGTVLKEVLNIDIDEGEIGYLALHFGAAIERSSMKSKTKRCLIVCASGLGSAKLLYYKLRSKYGSDLDIIGTTEYYKLSEFPFETIDFVISTIPLKEKLPVPAIFVHSILDQSDLKKVEDVISGKAANSFKYTRKELTFLNKDFRTKKEVLAFLSLKLQELQYVDETFLDSVFEREEASPTCFGNLVAVPHPLKPQTDGTFWVICTLKKPIQWADKSVQFVCLLCVQKDGEHNLKRMYEMLLGILENSELVHQLLKCENYQQFTSVLLKNI
ncbi:BglG family transcription antiterminator [Domibacillus sp. A3M-37]|uniref:BglG family transcription antiterminator n=1 Tax=Domibacillus sp. A3M-37 TaxID=2962037 RepID=UPI0020B718FF|nr:BglG family transcription antiterminator [Domibacillus sp. A3M-37]MCP3763712.1 BglG family transcription antiterminator [Domibacillus sp. A3M-37]